MPFSKYNTIESTDFKAFMPEIRAFFMPYTEGGYFLILYLPKHPFIRINICFF
jgi:hypothetical protein